jgi:hypothetical protein
MYSRSELEAREGHHQRLNKFVNKNKSTGSGTTNYDNVKQYKAEWNAIHKEQVSEQCRTYYAANRQKILEQKKLYRLEKIRLKQLDAL